MSMGGGRAAENLQKGWKGGYAWGAKQGCRMIQAGGKVRRGKKVLFVAVKEGTSKGENQLASQPRERGETSRGGDHSVQKKGSRYGNRSLCFEDEAREGKSKSRSGESTV